jgi:hypothetical protein
MVTGGAAALVLMLITVDPRRDLDSMARLDWLVMKLLFALSVIGAGAPFLVHSMRPGLKNGTNWGLIFLPFIAIIAVAIELMLNRPQMWRRCSLGRIRRLRRAG